MHWIGLIHWISYRWLLEPVPGRCSRIKKEGCDRWTVVLRQTALKSNIMQRTFQQKPF